MYKDFSNKRRPSGSKMREPRVANKVLDKYLKSNKSRFMGFYPNTELGVDLKLMTCKPGRLEEGITLPGVITRDGEFHFTFKEVTSIFALVKRNPQVFCGDFITVTRRDDGTLRLNFRPKTMGPDFNAASYATDVANEILWALTGLLGK